MHHFSITSVCIAYVLCASYIFQFFGFSNLNLSTWWLAKPRDMICFFNVLEELLYDVHSSCSTFVIRDSLRATMILLALSWIMKNRFSFFFFNSDGSSYWDISNRTWSFYNWLVRDRNELLSLIESLSLLL